MLQPSPFMLFLTVLCLWNAVTHCCAIPIEESNRKLFCVTLKGKIGFIDRDGKIVIEPTFENAFPFTEGLAAVQRIGKWGFIDETGREIIQPQFDNVGQFSDGLATFSDQRRPNKFGYIDKSGRVVIEAKYDAASNFRHGLARVGTEKFISKLFGKIADTGVECDYKFIDRSGKVVQEPSPLHYATGRPQELIRFEQGTKTGYLNANGIVVIEPRFQVASEFSEGLACVREAGRFGYIDAEGKWVIPPRFEAANNFSDGLAGVQINDSTWAFIDRDGKVMIPGPYNWIYGGFQEGLAEVAFEGKRGYINKKGEWIWKPSE